MVSILVRANKEHEDGMERVRDLCYFQWFPNLALRWLSSQGTEGTDRSLFDTTCMEVAFLWPRQSHCICVQCITLYILLSCSISPLGFSTICGTHKAILLLSLYTEAQNLSDLPKVTEPIESKPALDPAIWLRPSALFTNQGTFALYLQQSNRQFKLSNINNANVKCICSKMNSVNQ